MESTIAYVVPIRDFPIKTRGFDYLLPKNKKLKIGQLCLIDFRNNLCLGVILDFKENSQFSNLKTISPLEKDIVFPSAWLKTIEWFAEFYHYSLGSTLKLFFPTFGKKLNFVFSEQLKGKGTVITDKKFAKINLHKNKQPATIIFHANNHQIISSYYQYLTNNFQQQNKNILIICADQFASKKLSQQLSNFPVIILDSSLTQKQWRENWLQTLLPGFKIIITSQKGCLTPINNLGLIIVDQENSAGLIQRERNPRYDCRQIALSYAQNSQVPLIYTSLSVSMFCLSLAQKKLADYYNVELNKRPEFVVVDQKTELVASKNKFGPVSEQALKKFYRNEKNKPIFIFSFYHQSKKVFCFYCQKENSADEKSCRACRQPLTNDRKSLVGIENELKSIDLQSSSADNFRQESKIFIGGLKHLNIINDLGLSIIIDADNILNIPNYQSSEKLRNIVDYLTSISEKTLVLTKNPDHHCYQQNFMIYAKTELGIRKKYNYHPYGQIYHVIAKNFVDEEVDLFKSNLKIHFPNENIEINGPFKDKAGKNCFLLIKSNSDNTIAKIGNYMYSNWMLDRHPADLLK